MRRATPAHSRQEQLEGRARLIASVERMRGGRRRSAIAALGLAGAAAAVAAVLVRRPAPAPVGWHVEDGAVEAQGYISAREGSPSARLAFDDGSEVTLVPGSRGRVAATSPTGAEVVLEQGRAWVHVQHHERTAWTIDAGPYAVHVTGTDFLVSWAAEAETLDVWMRAGRVVVTGPVLGDEVTLSAGKHLVARLRDRTFQIDGSPEPSGAPPSARLAAPEGSVPSVDAPATSNGRAPVLPRNAEPASPSPSSPADTRSWATRVAAGDYARVVSDAASQGMDRVISTRPLGDLRALGDAARYADRSDVAKRAYTTIRERFPSSSEARTAAFLLGRVAEEQEHASGQALRWYDTYYAESPAGPFAGDALGRKMILVSRAQGRDAARPLAQRYVERFPLGTYSAAAHDLAP
jgi:hypothetical protein